MKKNVVIYSNCHGNIIKTMFEKHPFTNKRTNVIYFVNYENLHKKKLSLEHLNILKSCDIFIYQPFNNHHDNTEYDIENIKKKLRDDTMIISVNYYRFKGFWYNCIHFPYENYEEYKFSNLNNSGLYENITKISDKNSKKCIKSFIDNIEININELEIAFNNELENFKKIDNKSDVNMFDFFKYNYHNTVLFHDPYHPTNFFFYEIFKQLVKKIFDEDLIDKDLIFIESLKKFEMTHWCLPILPTVKSHFGLKYPEIYKVFYEGWNPSTLCLNIYDYYYIRLCKKNFELFLKENKLKIFIENKFNQEINNQNLFYLICSLGNIFFSNS